jgi:hypothetical protein
MSRATARAAYFLWEVSIMNSTIAKLVEILEHCDPRFLEALLSEIRKKESLLMSEEESYRRLQAAKGVTP